MTPPNNHDSTAGPNTSEPAIELAERFALIVNQHPVIRSGFVLLRQQEALFREPLVVLSIYLDARIAVFETRSVVVSSQFNQNSP